MQPFVRVVYVEPLDHGFARITFSNGEVREQDLTGYISEGEVFRPVREDAAFFRAVHVAGGTVAWPNGADIDPYVLYYGLEPA